MDISLNINFLHNPGIASVTTPELHDTIFLITSCFSFLLVIFFITTIFWLKIQYQKKIWADKKNSFHLFLDSSDYAYFIVDSMSKKITDVNYKALEITQYSLSELKEKEYTDIFLKDKNLFMKEWVINSVHLNNFAGQTTYILNKNRKEVPVEIKRGAKFQENKRNFWLLTLNDITIRNKKEQELYLHKYGTDNASYLIIWIDINGNIVYMNKNAYKTTGCNAENILNLKIWDLYKPINPESWKTVWINLKTKGSLTKELTINNSENGSLLNFEATINYIDYKNREIVICYIHDITELKKNQRLLLQKEEQLILQNNELTENNLQIQQINKDLIKAKEKAIESDRLKFAFLANVNHEIRTPMNGIAGFSELLTKPDITPDKIPQYIQIINTCCKQLLAIMNDIIDISKIETGQLEINFSKTNINKIITDITALYQPQADRKDITITNALSLPNNESEIMADDIRLNQIFNNLINNALKFTDKGTIEIGYHIKKKFIEFYVSDTGIGVEPENYKLIFERFRQVQNDLSNIGGTGLGLSITKGLVEVLGGTIWVKSSINKGSTFYFTIPYIPSANFKSSKIILNEINYNWANKNILVIEPNISHYSAIESVISETAANIIHSVNGEEAIEIVRALPDIDIAMISIELPTMDGYKTATLIKELRPRLNIVALTSFALSADRNKIINSGFSTYITKPINKKDLLRKIEQVLKKQDYSLNQIKN